MKKLALAVVITLLALGSARAQVIPQPGPANPFGCAYNSSPPTLSSGQAGIVQCDASGKILISGGSGGSSAITSWAGGTLGAMANYGTSPGAVLVPGMNAFITNTPAVTQSGSWNVGLTGTLPAFASTPAFTISGTLPAFASTPAVTISGTLPAFASTPAVSLSGTLPAFASTPSVNLNNVATNSSGASTLIQCDSTAKYDASTTGATQLVALSSGKTIYVCGYDITTGGTATNVKLQYGTGTACATGTTDITPAYQLSANSGIVHSSSFYQGLKTAASNALCVNASAANAVQVLVYYAQF